MDIVKKVLDVAYKEGLGFKETLGSNDGPQVRKYQDAVLCFTSCAWCNAFAWWAIDTACKEIKVNNPVIRTAYVPSTYQWAKQKGIIYDRPKPGDLVIFDDGRTDVPPYYHIGIVVKWAGGNDFTTIEGNTDSQGGGEGDGLYERTRSLMSTYYNCHFVRWINLMDKSVRPQEPSIIYKNKEVSNYLMLSGAAYAPVRQLLTNMEFNVSFNKDLNKITVIKEDKPNG